MFFGFFEHVFVIGKMFLILIIYVDIFFVSFLVPFFSTFISLPVPIYVFLSLFSLVHPVFNLTLNFLECLMGIFNVVHVAVVFFFSLLLFSISLFLGSVDLINSISLGLSVSEIEED